jgi:hypothetical protein
MTRRSIGLPIVATDFLFLLVLAFVLLINPPTLDGEVDAPGNMTAAIIWPEGSTDVDLWVTGPGQPRATGYSNRAGRLWNLLRDDLGTAGDNTPLNFEHAYSRGLPAGEYILNAHCYTCASAVPVSFEVRLGGPGERQELLFSGTETLPPKQERTLVRFKLDANGKVVPGSASVIFEKLRVGN